MITPRTSFVAISTLSHLPQALTAMKSLDPWAGSWARRIYLIGLNKDAECAMTEGVSVVGLPRWIRDWITHRLSKKYSISEICFALKPLVLRHELDKGVDNCHYIDGDIFFYSDPTNLVHAVEGRPVCLTPHYLTPRSESELPRQLTLLRAGVFNGGYVGVSQTPESLAFLDWWAERLTHHGYNKPKLGMSGDQRWLDLAPVLFKGTHIIREDCVNVAYWNLNERQISMSNTGLPLCNGRPLVFFHFSGFQLSWPSRLTKYSYSCQKTSERAIEKLCRDYAASVQRCANFDLQVFKNGKLNGMSGNNNRWRFYRERLLAWLTS